MTNKLFYGHSLHVPREHTASVGVDLIYLNASVKRAKREDQAADKQGSLL